MKKLILVSIIFIRCVAFVIGADFGFLLDQTAEYETATPPGALFTYTPSLTPWFSWNGGKGISVYLSGKASMKYVNSNDGVPVNDGWLKPALRFELSRFQMNYRNGDFSLDAGRVWYADTLGVAAGGLFDGVCLGIRKGAASMRMGLYYTGLLFKETAKVTMTASDYTGYAKAWDNNFGAYFASKRAMGAFSVDLPFMEYHNLSFEALAQFDLNGADDRLHSQYAEAKAEFFIGNDMMLSGGLLFETMQGGGDFFAAFGAFAAFGMEVPGALNDGLKVSVKYSSGNWNDTVTGIAPINTIEQGMVFLQPIDSLCVIRAAYDARLLPSLFAEASFGYFMHTGGNDALNGNLYGGEFWAALGWQPFNDLRVVAGVGVFIPAMGNIRPDTDPVWKLSAGLTISF